MTETIRQERTACEDNGSIIQLLSKIKGIDSIPTAARLKTTSLKGLAGQIKHANQALKSNDQRRQTVKQELLQESGIDFNREKIKVVQIKNQIERREMYIPQTKAELVSLEVNLKHLEFKQFAFTIEQEAAYRSVYQSINNYKSKKESTQNNGSRLKQIKFFNVNRMKNIKEATSPKLKNKESNAIQKQVKMDMPHLINKFGSGINLDNINEIDLQLNKHYLNNQFFNDKLTSRWLSVLFLQNEMISRISSPSEKFIDFNQNNANYFSVTCIQALNQIFMKTYKDKIDVFQHKYFKEARTRFSISHWMKSYFLLRSDKPEEFMQELKSADLEMVQVYGKVLDRLNHFQRLHENFNSVAFNEKSDHFQKILKLILQGKYQAIFQDVQPSVRALEQPWLILMALSLYRHGQKEQAKRVKHLKLAVNDYFNSLSQIALQRPYDLQLIVNFATGLLSLGNYKLLLIFYEKLKQQSDIQKNEFYLDFIHIFIVSLLNIKLLFYQTKQGQIAHYVHQTLNEILDYLVFLKTKKSEYLKTYFNITLYLLIHLTKLDYHLPLKDIIEQICSSLFLKFDDLKIVNSQQLEQLKQNTQILQLFQKNIVKNVKPEKQQQFMQLAQFCDSINQQHLQESILVKLIIFNYFQGQKIKISMQNGVFMNQDASNKVIKSRNVQIAQNYLQKTMRLEQKDILHFMKTLKRLRTYVMERNKNLLSTQMKELCKYRSSNHRIVGYLQKIDNKNKSGLFQVLLSYFENLSQLFRLLYLARSNLDKYEEQRTKLLEELQRVRHAQPYIAGTYYKKVLQSLQK